MEKKVRFSGAVKMFNSAKGFGFIKADTGTEYFFHVSELQGQNHIAVGDKVHFYVEDGEKGPRAVQVVSGDGGNRGNEDPRVTCTGCSKKIVPRIITYRGRPYKSICPYCGETYKKFGSCFIATAVYEDYDAPEVMVLRRFRDQKLMVSAGGRMFVKFYYAASPPIARFIRPRRALASCLKPLLDYLAKRLDQK